MVNLENLYGTYKGIKVLLTGHTGFKGTWLSEILNKLGAEVLGYSLKPDTTPSHFYLLANSKIKSITGDVRNYEKISNAIIEFQPKIVFHLAAQPLVKRSYDEPLLTYETNALGTSNVLNACRGVNSINAVICITTDKVYQNKDWTWGYRENDELGGYDPYSASKACSEIIINSYRQAYFNNSTFQIDHNTLISSARSGNVVGGGDWSNDRLIPDIVRSLNNNKLLEIRNPQSVRPWQHVLDCTLGYLLLGEKLLKDEVSFAEPWNFGPHEVEFTTVEEIVGFAKKYWKDLRITFNNSRNTFHETNILRLDSSKALKKLHWKPFLSGHEVFDWTFEWYNSYYRNNKVITDQQIEAYLKLIS